MNSNSQDIILAFGKDIISRPAVLQELSNLSTTYDKTAQQLYEFWNDKLRDQENDLPSILHLQTLKESLKGEYELQMNSSIPKDKSFLSVNTNAKQSMFDKDSLDAFLSQGNKSTPTARKVVLLNSKSSVHKSKSNTPKTPINTFKTPFKNLVKMESSPYTPSPGMPFSTFTESFANRSKKFHLIEEFNAHIPESLNSQESLVNISLAPGQLMQGYRYMYNKLADEGMSVDESIDAVAELIAAQEAALQTQNEEEPSADMILEYEKDSTSLLKQWIHPCNIPRQETFLTVGRICIDSVLENAKLNSSSILLESSRLIGNGSRIPLNLDSLIEQQLLQGYSLFPGQIVGIKGNNPSGRLLVAQEIVYPPLPPLATCTASRLLELYSPLEVKPMDVLIASGPFTLLDSLEYEPWTEFLDKLEDKVPQVLILLGPFVDVSHPLLPSSPLSPQQLFQTFILDKLNNLLNLNSFLQVILIPCTSDLIHEWPLLPQPPLVLDPMEYKTHERLLLLPNPASFLLNECLVSVSNTDTLLEMASAESGRESQQVKSDRVSLMYRHLLQQRHLHPISPTLNKIHYEHIDPFVLGVRPDLLIMPSVLKPSVKQVEGVLCVNPGKLCKGKVSGNYCRMWIYPLNMQELSNLNEDEELNLEIGLRSRTGIYKL